MCAITGAGNDYQKDKQFQKLNASKDVFEVKVIRGGQESLVLNTELVVGDVLIVDTGDKLCAGTNRSPADYEAFQLHLSGMQTFPLGKSLPLFLD